MFNFLTILSGSAIVAGIIVYLAKILINRGFDVAYKTYENKLDLLKIEHQIKYSKLHEERGDILKQLYMMLYEIEEKLIDFTTTNKDLEEGFEERKELVKASLKSCEKFLDINRIYLSETFCSQLESIIFESKNIVISMMRVKNADRVDQTDIRLDRPRRFKDGDLPIDRWFELEDRVMKFKDKRKELANSFRELIGV